MIVYSALVGGLLLLLITLQDAFEVMLLPRRVQRRARLVRLYFQWFWRAWTFVARAWGARSSSRERFLSIFGAFAMMVLFGLWAALLIVAFGAIQWSVAKLAAAPPSDFGEQTYLSGVTFFTLGYGDVTPHSGAGKVIAVVEAGLGFGLMAVVIGYLPVLYQLFARRESLVLQLDARAGSPPSATALLVRHAESAGLGQIDEMLRAWELWAADLLESHLSYPMLAYYRSQHDDQSWLAALTAMMDVCALILVGVTEVKPLQARMTFAMARHVVVEMARSLEVPATKRTSAARLSADDFERVMSCLREKGVDWSGGETAEEILTGVRATYESLAQGLADYLLLELPGWLPDSDSPDHWDRGPRGIIARRLIKRLAENSS